MAKKLYVGNLSHDITDSELQSVFEPYGAVVSAQVIVDRDTRRSKGFGFVEMSSEEEAAAAINALNTKEVHGRPLTVNIARPREERPGGSFRGSSSGGNRRGGGGGSRRY